MRRAGMFMGRILKATLVGVFAGCQGEPRESGPATTSQEVKDASRNCVQCFAGITRCAYVINMRSQGEAVTMSLPHGWWNWTSVQLWAYMDRMRHPDIYFGQEGFGVSTGVVPHGGLPLARALPGGAPPR
ncbi:hypothetical protein D7Y23_07995 [Corallococcus sp. AB050B]|nr:hypothetical protein D7Y23_07995 [Corallococcus sp. AB050B]